MTHMTEKDHASWVERRESERSELKRSGAQDASAPEVDPLIAIPNPEVEEKPKRRRFTAEYKLKILDEVDNCSGPGDVGKILRREGLYSSYLAQWRRQRERGAQQGLSVQKRGRKKKKEAMSPEMKALRKENRRLKNRLERVELMLEFQKKTSEMLGIPLSSPENDEDD